MKENKTEQRDQTEGQTEGQKCSRCEYMAPAAQKLYLGVCPYCWQILSPTDWGYFDDQTACWGGGS